MRSELLAAALMWLAGGSVFESRAQSLESASLSPDVTVRLDGLVFADDDIAVDNLLGLTVPTSVGSLPESAAVTAYYNLGGGEHLFALDITAELAGPVTVYPADVVRYDGGTYTIEFDSAAEGVPAGARVDAVSRTGGDLLFSFDTTVNLGGVVAADEDVVQWNGASFSLALDSSAAGIDPALDLDAVDDAGGGQFWVSFDGHGNLGGQTFADEDVLLLDPTGPSLVAYDGSAQDSDWVGADLEAVYLPEPGVGGLLVGLGLLLGLPTRRS